MHRAVLLEAQENPQAGIIGVSRRQVSDGFRVLHQHAIGVAYVGGFGGRGDDAVSGGG